MSTNNFKSWFESEAKPRLADRANTFTQVFDYLNSLGRPVHIVETGCVRMRGDWQGAGCSTIMFDKYIQHNWESSLTSVDIDRASVKLATDCTSSLSKIICADSVEFLKSLARDGRQIDLLYLDSMDYDHRNPIPSSLHHLNELMAALPLLRPDTLVVVDDSPTTFQNPASPHGRVDGKGQLVALYAESVGAKLRFAEYQIGWTDLVGRSLSWNLREVLGEARAEVEAGHLSSADAIYSRILELTSPPKTPLERVAHGEACAFYARSALARGKAGTASDWYLQALNADPLATQYRVELAVRALRAQGLTQEAYTEAKRAVRIAPDMPLAWHTLGGIEHELGNVDACIDAYDRQLELVPDDSDALLDRASIALDQEDYDLVRSLCTSVSEPRRMGDVFHCLGMIDHRRGEHESAIDLFQRAIDHGCYDVPVAHYHKSLSLQTIGRYAEGWQEHEWRKDQKNNPGLALAMKRFAVPIFAFQAPPAKVHVHLEAGFGDNICLMRYMKFLADRGYDVRCEIQDSLIDLVQRSFPTVKVMPRALDFPGALGLPIFDYHIPMCSFPAVFGTDIDSVPWFGPYLTPDPAKVEYYNQRLGLSGQRRIGLCWSSGIRDGVWIEKYGRYKSMSYDTLMPIAKRPATKPKSMSFDVVSDVVDHLHSFVSLQVGPERSENDGGVSDLLPDNPTWDDTAALIANLDLVITVDTAVAHLAGALGIPTYVMVAKTAGSWHWMTERSDSPWYPSVRLFRQKTKGDWESVIAEIRQLL